MSVCIGILTEPIALANLFPHDAMATHRRKFHLPVNLPEALEILFTEMAAINHKSVDTIIALFVNIGLSVINRQPNVLRVMRSTGNSKSYFHLITIGKRKGRQLHLLASACGRKPTEFTTSLIATVWDYHHNPEQMPNKEEIILKIDFELAVRFAHLRA